MIAAVMLMSVALVGILCVVAYTLATYALPLMLGFAAARFAYHTGSGLIGAGLHRPHRRCGRVRRVFDSVSHAAVADPASHCGTGFCGACRHSRLHARPRRDPRNDPLCNLATDILLHRRGARRRLGADAVGRFQNSSSFVRMISQRSCLLVVLMTLLLKDGAEDTLRAHST